MTFEIKYNGREIGKEDVRKYIESRWRELTVGALTGIFALSLVRCAVGDRDININYRNTGIETLHEDYRRLDRDHQELLKRVEELEGRDRQ